MACSEVKARSYYSDYAATSDQPATSCNILKKILFYCTALHLSLVAGCSRIAVVWTSLKVVNLNFLQNRFYNIHSYSSPINFYQSWSMRSLWQRSRIFVGLGKARKVATRWGSQTRARRSRRTRGHRRPLTRSKRRCLRRLKGSSSCWGAGSRVPPAGSWSGCRRLFWKTTRSSILNSGLITWE